jgi:hypothetical protein
LIAAAIIRLPPLSPARVSERDSAAPRRFWWLIVYSVRSLESVEVLTAPIYHPTDGPHATRLIRLGWRDVGLINKPPRAEWPIPGLRARWGPSLRARRSRWLSSPDWARDRGPALGQQAGGARMGSEAWIALGTEAGSDGRRIGRDPRKMRPDELRALGHAPMAPTAAIRAHCLDCCGGSSDEVRKCVALRCPSWPFRFGANPWRAPLSEAERARRRERIARVGKRAGNSPQPEKPRGVDAASPSAPNSAPAAEAREP